MTRLRARVAPLPAPVDLTDVAGDDGFLFQHGDTGLAGRGVALRVEVPADPAGRAGAVADALRAVEVTGEPVGGAGPVAFLALAFDPSAPATAVVPALTVGRSAEGARWAVTVGDDPPPPVAAAATEAAPRVVRGGGFRVAPGQDPESWKATVAGARELVRAGRIEKVVLARDVTVEADGPVDRGALVRRLAAAYRRCYVTSVEGMVGASPELLVSRRGEVVRSQPMAGTIPRAGDPADDARGAAELLASAKDRAEHQVTIDVVHDLLLPYCSYLDWEPEPSVVAVANVQHLATFVQGRLSTPPASALELASVLHPTPAVCGRPREAALAAIAELEGMDRGRYAGPVGWVDAAGDGAFAVGIRCAEVAGHRARLFAGVGVVADSDPDAELAETQAKLQPLLAALVRP